MWNGSPRRSVGDAEKSWRECSLPESKALSGDGAMERSVRIRVRLFATFREIVGTRQLTWSAEDGITAGKLVDQLLAKYPRLAAHRGTMLVAVNESFASPERPLVHGDEVALMPPVSGGAGVRDVQRGPVDTEAVLRSVQRDDAGAVVLFLGTVRSDPGVKALEYEVYRPMALKQMAEIAELAKKRFGVLEVSIVHRLGHVSVGKPSVAIAVSAPHREEAFAACEWAMTEVKRIVPIWKAESSGRTLRSGRGGARRRPDRRTEMPRR
jgi:MoaE-MoaD fusion protein